MKYILIIFVFILSSCDYRTSDHVSQSPTTSYLSGKIYIATYVWYKHTIVKSWYDEMIPANDSIIKDRKIEAEKYLEWCKNLNLEP